MKRLIGVLNFDSIATFEEFQRIVVGLLDGDFKLEILQESRNIIPPYGAWLIEITKEEV